MVRLAPFPLAFGGCLIFFAWGFVNRRKWFPEVEDVHRRRAIEKNQQAEEFKAKLAEGIKKERAKKAAGQKVQ